MPSTTYRLAALVFALAASFVIACGDDDAPADVDASVEVDAFVPAEEDASVPEEDASMATEDASSPTEPTIVGDWMLAGTPLILRFGPADARGVGEQRLADSPEALDDPSMLIGGGTYRLDGSRLTFTNTTGNCSTPIEHQVGIYDIVLDHTTLSFTLVDDPCAIRTSLGGVTVTR